MNDLQIQNRKKQAADKEVRFARIASILIERDFSQKAGKLIQQ